MWNYKRESAKGIIKEVKAKNEEMSIGRIVKKNRMNRSRTAMKIYQETFRFCIFTNWCD